jgi:esterase/lipase
MKNFGAILAIGITAIIVLVIGSANIFLAVRAETSDITVETPAPVEVEENTITQDVEAIRAAYEARETLLLSQIAEMDAELTDRQKAYDLHFQELNELIVNAEEQLTQLENQEILLQEQNEQLVAAQEERTISYESQRQNAYYQYQINIQQLQTQLDEGKAKLNEALVRLGQ